MTLNAQYLRSLVALLLFTSPFASAAEPSPLIGFWKMVKLEVMQDGEFTQVPYSGQLIVSDKGTLSAQAMDMRPSPPDSPYTLNGYEALYGNIVIDDATGTFVNTVQSSVVKALIGQKMHRGFSVSGNQMVLTPVDKSEGWQVTYKRY